MIYLISSEMRLQKNGSSIVLILTTSVLSGVVIWFDAQITIGIWIVKKTTCQANFRHRLGDEKLSLATGPNGANFLTHDYWK